MVDPEVMMNNFVSRRVIFLISIVQKRSWQIFFAMRSIWSSVLLLNSMYGKPYLDNAPKSLADIIRGGRLAAGWCGRSQIRGSEVRQETLLLSRLALACSSRRCRRDLRFCCLRSYVLYLLSKTWTQNHSAKRIRDVTITTTTTLFRRLWSEWAWGH